MLFHQKFKDIDDDFYENFQVLCGIEEEFLIIDENGTLKEAADEIMMKAASILENNAQLLKSLKIKIRSLDAEPSPSQIEYVTLPLEPDLIEEAVNAGRKLLTTAAKDLDVKILAQSMHPIQSDPNPISGTHINVSVRRKGILMKPVELQAVHNYLWDYLPEIIGISANSPIYKGSKTNIASNRCANSSVLKRNGFASVEVPDKSPALVPMRYYGRMRYTLKIGSGEDEFSRKVITNTRGERLVDITPRGPFTNIAQDAEELPTRNRVEVRIVDVQQNVQDLLDISYLCCLSAMDAIYLHLSGKINKDPFHDANVEKAIANGKNSTFKRGNGSNESLEQSLNRWIDDIEMYQDYLGIKIKNLPNPKLQQESVQNELNIKYGTRKIEKLRQQGRNHALVQLNDSRVVSDRSGTTYQIKPGARVRGVISVDYNLSYNKLNGLVTNFNDIRIVNNLEVEGLKIPLNNNDRVINVSTPSESIFDRLFGNFGF
jgi:gamma-glutamyl:cysteine ligase YbdK (ATP-grasp superfamily)